MQARHRACLQLVGEVEVQGRAIDAARTNVEKHYRYIFDSYDAFMQKYTCTLNDALSHAFLMHTFACGCSSKPSLKCVNQPSG